MAIDLEEYVHALARALAAATELEAVLTALQHAVAVLLRTDAIENILEAPDNILSAWKALRRSLIGGTNADRLLLSHQFFHRGFGELSDVLLTGNY